MNIETLELIHKLLTEHVDNASRCCDRARGKRNSTPDDDQNYERYDMKLREADKAKFAAQDAESCLPWTPTRPKQKTLYKPCASATLPAPWKNAKSARTTTMTAKAMAANRIRILWICLCRYTRKEAMENEAT